VFGTHECKMSGSIFETPPKVSISIFGHVESLGDNQNVSNENSDTVLKGTPHSPCESSPISDHLG
jgi:hypothetical protein